MPCSLGTKATVKLLSPEPPLLPPPEADPPLPFPHAARVTVAARPSAAISLVVRVILIGHLIGVGMCVPRCHPARRAGGPQVVRVAGQVGRSPRWRSSS